MSYLIDTKPAPSTSLVAWIAEQTDEDLFISSLTAAEVHRSALEAPVGRKRDALIAWLSGPEGRSALFAGRVLPFDEKAGSCGHDSWLRVGREAVLATRSTGSSRRSRKPTIFWSSPTTSGTSPASSASIRCEACRHEEIPRTDPERGRRLKKFAGGGFRTRSGHFPRGRRERDRSGAHRDSGVSGLREESRARGGWSAGGLGWWRMAESGPGGDCGSWALSRARIRPEGRKALTGRPGTAGPSRSTHDRTPRRCGVARRTRASPRRCSPLPGRRRCRRRARRYAPPARCSRRPFARHTHRCGSVGEVLEVPGRDRRLERSCTRHEVDAREWKHPTREAGSGVPAAVRAHRSLSWGVHLFRGRCR